MQQKSSSSSSAARSRNIEEMEDSSLSDLVSVISSLPGDSNDDSEVRSMTAKGINHLCSELLELKAESNGDFHSIIISNYLSFSRIFEEVTVMLEDLVQQKSHISTQTNTVKDILDGIDIKFETEETEDSSLEVIECFETSHLVDLEAHIYDVSNALDTLIYENKIDEALGIVRVEDENLQRLKVEEKFPFDLVMLYGCVIYDKKAKIKLRLERISADVITPASELNEAATTELLNTTIQNLGLE